MQHQPPDAASDPRGSLILVMSAHPRARAADAGEGRRGRIEFAAAQRSATCILSRPLDYVAPSVVDFHQLQAALFRIQYCT